MVLVTGGTGLVGSHLLFALIEKGFHPRATYRNKGRIENVKKVFSYYSDKAEQLFERIEWVQCDINDIPQLEVSFEEVSQVYHCAALISFDPNDHKKLLKTNVEGTANIVNLCIEKQVKKLCHVSSIAAIGRELTNKPITEETEWTRINNSGYGLSKYEAEMEVWRGAQEGVDAVIVNPGVILGPGFWKEGSGKLFYQVDKGLKYYLPGGTGFVGVNDVTKAMITLMDSDIKNERFILVGENMTFKNTLVRIANGLKTKPPSRELKPWILEIFWRLDRLKSSVFGSKRRLSKNMAKSLQKTENYSADKIVEHLDFQFEPMESVIASCSAIFRQDYS